MVENYFYLKTLDMLLLTTLTQFDTSFFQYAQYLLFSTYVQHVGNVEYSETFGGKRTIPKWLIEDVDQGQPSFREQPPSERITPSKHTDLPSKQICLFEKQIVAFNSDSEQLVMIKNGLTNHFCL